MAEYKGFDPSKRKLEQARKEGNVLKTPLLTQAFVFLCAGLAACYGLGKIFLDNRFLIQCFDLDIRQPLSHYLSGALELALLGSLVAIVPGVLAAILLEWWQVGLKVEPGIVAPKFERLNPAQGLQRIWEGAIGSWEGILRIIIASTACAMVLYFAIPELTVLIGEPVELIVVLGSKYTVRLVSIAAVVMLALAAVEYGINRRKFIADLSMSLDDVRREHKEDEGDPFLKSTRKQLHENLSREDLVSRVRKSKVIIVERASG